VVGRGGDPHRMDQHPVWVGRIHPHRVHMRHFITLDAHGHNDGALPLAPRLLQERPHALLAVVHAQVEPEDLTPQFLQLVRTLCDQAQDFPRVGVGHLFRDIRQRLLPSRSGPRRRPP
jgi:hypothetical protein